MAVASSPSRGTTTTAHSHLQSHKHRLRSSHAAHSPPLARSRASSRKSGDPFIVERPDSVRTRSGGVRRSSRATGSLKSVPSFHSTDIDTFVPSSPSNSPSRFLSTHSFSLSGPSSAGVAGSNPSRGPKPASATSGPVVNRSKWRVVTCLPGEKALETTTSTTAAAPTATATMAATAATPSASSVTITASTAAAPPAKPSAQSAMNASTKSKSRAAAKLAAAAAAASATPPSGGPSAQPRSGNITKAAVPTPAKGMKPSVVATLPPAPTSGMAPFPLSARKAPPLDLNTVARRRPPAHPSPDGRAAPEPSKPNRHFGLKECPTYRPTTEEFRDPLKYIRSIADEGKKYGMVKIIPPDTWNPPFAIDTEKFHFRTRRQELNEVEGSNRESVTYLEALAKFHKQNSSAHLHRFPCVDKRPLDLYRLKRLVEEKGGFDSVCKTKRWAEIGRDLGYSGKIMSSLSTSLKNSYQKWIQSFEQYIAKNRAAVFHDGTPSPARNSVAKPGSASCENTASRSSKPNDGQAADVPKPSSPASLHSTPASELAQPTGSSGFTAVNRVGDRPALSRTSSANAKVKTEPGTSTGGQRKRELDSPDTAPVPRRSKRTKRENGSAVPSPAPSQPKTPLRPTAVKDEAADTFGFAPSGEGCEVCGKVDDNLRECDGCDCVYHFDCLEEKQRPSERSEWHCPKCLVGTGDYGFQDGSTYSLRQFQEKARFFKQNHFNKIRDKDKDTDQDKGDASEIERPRDADGNVIVTEDEVEREFWRLTESLTEPVEVEYGADIHSGIHGSGFPTLEKFPEDPYSLDGWNLNNIPFEKESLFRHIKSDINGMTVPWVYVGMCFSCFCWHAEDHNTYSINYQHFGETKTWYAIPSDSFSIFEEATYELAPELTEKQPDLLYQLVTLFAPDRLRAYSVDVYAADQRAGQFIITFPQAYHAGFNHGFNLNEAVNFAPSDWEPLGGEGVERLRKFRRAPCFSHDELLMTIASKDQSIRTARWLGPAIKKMHDREQEDRDLFHRYHSEAVKSLLGLESLSCSTDEVGEMFDDSVSKIEHKCTNRSDERGGNGESLCGLLGAREDPSLGEEEYVCAYCNGFTYLSRMYCHHSKKSYCLDHVGEFDCCPMIASLGDKKASFGTEKAHTLYQRYAILELDHTDSAINRKGESPDEWAGKVRELCSSSAAPQLKALKALLAEGERIHAQWDISADLIPLRQFVAKCAEWTDAASTFISRKQARRRSRRDERATGDKDGEADREREGSEDGRTLSELQRLIHEAEFMHFDCPELALLKERSEQVREYQESVLTAVSGATSSREIQPLVTLGRALGVSGVEEVDMLEELVRKLNWWEEVRNASEKIDGLPRDRCLRLIEEADGVGISVDDDSLAVLKQLISKADSWEARAQSVLAVEQVHDQQLEALSRQAVGLPVVPATLSAVEHRLNRQRAARDAISTLLEASRDEDFRRRPRYRDVRAAVDEVSELSATSKPAGTADLERELKRHEDWMRRGKKLFGKANAPLHILLQHMQYVDERNRACLDVESDVIEERPDAEGDEHVISNGTGGDGQPQQQLAGQGSGPDGATKKSRSSAAVASDKAGEKDGKEKRGAGASGADSDRQNSVFCICRKAEWGMMVECELCHEWYHGRCLKISRTKLKEDEKFTCPICDYRVMIPRDAARPKLEDCIGWQDEIRALPFQPDEEETLRSIVDTAVEFREYLAPFIAVVARAGAGGDNDASTSSERNEVEGSDVGTTAATAATGAPSPPLPSLSAIRFFLRKLEGADILLVHETNLLRSRLYDLAPVGPDRPQPIAESLSTRKPRPTKQQKMMVQYGVSTPDELPAHVKIRKRKENATVALTLSPSVSVPAPAGAGSGDGIGQEASGGGKGEKGDRGVVSLNGSGSASGSGNESGPTAAAAATGAKNKRRGIQFVTASRPPGPEGATSFPKGGGVGTHPEVSVQSLLSGPTGPVRGSGVSHSPGPQDRGGQQGGSASTPVVALTPLPSSTGQAPLGSGTAASAPAPAPAAAAGQPPGSLAQVNTRLPLAPLSKDGEDPMSARLNARSPSCGPVARGYAHPIAHAHVHGQTQGSPPVQHPHSHPHPHSHSHSHPHPHLHPVVQGMHNSPPHHAAAQGHVHAHAHSPAHPVRSHEQQQQQQEREQEQSGGGGDEMDVDTDLDPVAAAKKQVAKEHGQRPVYPRPHHHHHHHHHHHVHHVHHGHGGHGGHGGVGHAHVHHHRGAHPGQPQAQVNGPSQLHQAHQTHQFGQQQQQQQQHQGAHAHLSPVLQPHSHQHPHLHSQPQPQPHSHSHPHHHVHHPARDGPAPGGPALPSSLLPPFSASSNANSTSGSGAGPGTGSDSHSLLHQHLQGQQQLQQQQQQQQQRGKSSHSVSSLLASPTDERGDGRLPAPVVTAPAVNPNPKPGPGLALGVGVGDGARAGNEENGGVRHSGAGVKTERAEPGTVGPEAGRGGEGGDLDAPPERSESGSGSGVGFVSGGGGGGAARERDGSVQPGGAAPAPDLQPSDRAGLGRDQSPGRDRAHGHDHDHQGQTRGPNGAVGVGTAG